MAWDGPGHIATKHVSGVSMDQTAAWTVPVTTTPPVTVSLAAASVGQVATAGTVN